MIDSPFFNIIVATYNSENNIRTLIESLNRQIFKDFKVIFKDKHSNDNTVDIIKKNSLFNYDLIVNDDHNIYDAWNQAINISSGKYIIFLGDDDLVYQKSLLILFNFIKTFMIYDIVHCKVKVKFNNKKYKIIGKEFDDNLIQDYLMINHTLCAHKSTIFNEFKFDTHYNIASDYKFFLENYNNLKIGFINEILVESTASGVSTKIDIFKECLKIKNNYNEKFIRNYFHYFISIIKFIIRKII